MDYAWLDRGYDAQSWSKELKEKFRKPLITEKFFIATDVTNWKWDTTEHILVARLYSIQPDLNAGSI